MMWNGIPVIRKEIAERMIKKYGLSQRETAEKLGITPSAVCQYISNKRGKIEIKDNGINKEITISAERIIQNGSDHLVIETCRICRLIQQSKGSSAFRQEKK
ncbi:MAG TPA: helix-turn-helix domain-containing protein [Candidatus Thermoplasmatota archaeon]|nr:helix-turn-helix domain-containing protein [Candidatus Thermoplasmatota archaeon]